MHARIDLATAADIAALNELLALLFAQEAEFQPDAELQASGLAWIIDAPDAGAILVARQVDAETGIEAGAAKIVGMVNLLFTVSTALGARVALLEDMIVAPESRASGVGSQLLSAAIDLAREQGCRRITLLTDRDNAAAQRFYARHGFTASDMLPMRLSLTASDQA